MLSRTIRLYVMRVYDVWDYIGVALDVIHLGMLTGLLFGMGYFLVKEIINTKIN